MGERKNESVEEEEGFERRGGASSKGDDRQRKSKRRKEESSSGDSDDDRARSRKKRPHRRSRRDSSSSDSHSDCDSDRRSGSDVSESESEGELRRRRRKEKRRKEKEKEQERRKRRKEREKERERKGSRDDEKKKTRDRDKKKKKKKDNNLGKTGAVTNSWGKYGTIKETDMWNKRPEFTAWLSEVKQVNLETLSNWEEKDMFKQFMEDHNTATFPSKKYYDVDTYHRRKLEKDIKKGHRKVQETERTVFNDEEQRRQEILREREKMKAEQVENLKRSMQGGMAQAMKDQARLREEMNYQYRVGNFEAAAAIQRRLDPDVAM